MRHLIATSATIVAALTAALGMPAAAADVSVLEKAGAVHLPPPRQVDQTARSNSFSPGLIPPARAEPRNVLGNPETLQVPAVRLTGMILPGDADKVRDVLATLASAPAVKTDSPLTTIELSSMGGSLLEGFALGKTLRKFKMLAVVRRGDLCLSACALAMVGGNVKQVPQSYPTRCNVENGGMVGFHNFFLNPNGLREATAGDPVASRLQGFADARGGAAALVKYAAEMNLPPSFVANLIGRPPDQFDYVDTAGDFLTTGMCPVSLTRPAIALADQAANVCANSMRNVDDNSPLQVRELQAAQAKRYLLERLQQQMLAARRRGRLAGLLADGRVMRVDKEIDSLYEDLRAAAAPLPDIVGPVFEVGHTEASNFQVDCYVSLSPDDPDNFDVVMVGANGLSEPPNVPPENSRRLFLYSRDTVINRSR